MERLQKYLAECGVASRRKAEELIKEGLIKVNGCIITELGTKVSGNDIITYKDEVVSKKEHIYLAMNKPRGVISSTSDESGRKTVISILPTEYQNYRLFPIGRLDYDTKGLILLTNDGEFMNELIGPSSNLEKEYLARVEGIFTKDDLKKITSGIKIDNYTTRKCRGYIDSIDRKNNSSLVGLIIKEGKYHQVKNMFLSVNHPVKRLTRIRIGEITLEGIPEGCFRELTIHEVKRLYVTARS